MDGLGKNNPHYDAETDSLYFANYYGTLLYRYSLRDNTTQTITVDGLTYPSFFIPVNGSNDQYLVNTNSSVYLLKWDGRSEYAQIEQPVFTLSPDATIDTGYTSSAGELYTGSSGYYCVGEPTQSFYRYTRANGLETIGSNFSSTVGSAIINNTLFQLDGCLQILSAWDVDPQTRVLSKFLSEIL